ncbi:MAG: sulfurtransferase complex subunit TusD [Gammaproteobacteria bacterium]|nr:sulfurtransferase complex subunit TusD [Gammaproteobacteria bacterium]
MKFTLVINGAPWSSPSAHTALKFAETALSSGHEIYRLFFYQDGVGNASRYCVVPQDEEDIPARWETLITTHGIDAVVCAASALKHGVLDTDESERYDKEGANLRSGFTVSGLGQFIDAATQSDRVVSFVN